METKSSLEGATEAPKSISPEMQRHIIEVLKDQTLQVESLSADNRYMAARLGVFDNMVALFRAGGGSGMMSTSDGRGNPSWRAKQLIQELEASPDEKGKIIMENISVLQQELDVVNKKMHFLMDELKK